MESPSSMSPRNSGTEASLGSGMRRSVSFSGSVMVAEAYGNSEYKREGYKNRNKKYWFFEKIRHDEDESWFYCDIDEEDDEDGGLMMAMKSKSTPHSPALRKMYDGGEMDRSLQLAPPIGMRRTASAPPAPPLADDDWDPVLAQLMGSVGSGSGY